MRKHINVFVISGVIFVGVVFYYAYQAKTGQITPEDWDFRQTWMLSSYLGMVGGYIIRSLNN